jgi:hypothetical protein
LLPTPLGHFSGAASCRHGHFFGACATLRHLPLTRADVPPRLLPSAHAPARLHPARAEAPPSSSVCLVPAMELYRVVALPELVFGWYLFLCEGFFAWLTEGQGLVRRLPVAAACLLAWGTPRWLWPRRLGARGGVLWAVLGKLVFGSITLVRPRRPPSVCVRLRSRGEAFAVRALTKR